MNCICDSKALPIAGRLAGAANIARGEMTKRSQPRDGIHALQQRRQRPSFDRDGLSARRSARSREVSDSKRKISSEASRPGATRSHQISDPPRSSLYARGLVEAGTGKRDQLIGQIFQVRVRCDAHAHALRSPAIRRAAAIHASGAGGSDLRLRTRPDVHLPRKANLCRECRPKHCARAPASLRKRVRKPRTTRQGGCCCLNAKNGRRRRRPLQKPNGDSKIAAIAQLMKRRV